MTNYNQEKKIIHPNQDFIRPVAFFRFEDLRIYHRAVEYSAWVHNTTKLYAGNEENSLVGKFNQSAQAIALNIAEGSSRNKSQFVYYLKMAKSAVRECVVLTSVSAHLNLLTEEQVEESRLHLMEMTKMLGALIGSLQRVNHERSQGREEFEDEEDFSELHESDTF